VRPHVRGGGEAEAPEAAVVQARGLLTLTALLGEPAPSHGTSTEQH